PWINLLPPTIVVGVANVDRRRDFTYPSTDGEFVAAYPGTGQSARFIRFIEEELQPLVRSRYPIDQQREALIGQSLGGLLATEILFKKPDLFDTYFIVSPSLWYDYESLLASEPVAYTQPKSIYVAVGKEGKVMQRGAKKLYQKLRKGNTTGSKLSFAYFKKHDHGDVLHQAIYTGFTELYGTQKEE
ncbi:MAG: alpha/beta hydrolase-fold protein, partial [Saprospiraceae bacterium]